METQIALLRVLQERQLERVGGTRAIPVDVRVVAATNRDLFAAVAEGAFRSDLFYRLNVFPIQVPSLRRRKEDVPLLVEYFVRKCAEQMGKKIRKIDERSMELCEAYPWPGNIRELQNIVERSVILCDGETLTIDEAWLSIQAPAPSRSPGQGQTLQDREKEAIEAALAEANGKVAGATGAAAKLGLPPSTLESKIRRFRIDKRRFTASLRH
jgi:formate hydrogenlyase transcriptional activator